MAEFKPNIYPIMYWALAFGAAAGVLLFVLFLLSQVITIAWFPVFLAGLIWGGYRNYKKQKQEWAAATGAAPTTGSPLDEFREAASDVARASRDLMQAEAPAPQAPVEEALPGPVEEMPPADDIPSDTPTTPESPPSSNPPLPPPLS